MGRRASSLPKDELERLIGELEDQMKQAARDLEFERAALLRGPDLRDARAACGAEQSATPGKRL